MLLTITLTILLLLLLAGLFYWLLVITEGVYLGRRAVVAMYEWTAHKYDDIKQYEDFTEQFFVAQPILYRLKHLPTPRVLDVATGTGRVPYYLLQEPHFNGRIVALDPAAKMLGLAQQKLESYGWRVGLVQQTAVPLPFAPASFDAVTCLESLEFFPDDAAALRQMVRVLCPGGLLLVTRRRGWEARTFIGRYRSADRFRILLESLGLVEVDIQPWQVNYDLVFARKPVYGERQPVCRSPYTDYG
jgi:ubiquinone/menaquinone biosynthesis C-methylase UbiE